MAACQLGWPSLCCAASNDWRYLFDYNCYSKHQLLILVLDICSCSSHHGLLGPRADQPTKPADLTGRARTVFVGTSPTCACAVCVCVCCWDAWISMGQGNDRALPASASHRCCDNQQNTTTSALYHGTTLAFLIFVTSLTPSTCSCPPPGTRCPEKSRLLYDSTQLGQSSTKENDLRTSGRPNLDSALQFASISARSIAVDRSGRQGHFFKKRKTIPT